MLSVRFCPFSLSSPYTSILVDWITEMVVGERLSITPAYATIHPAF